MWTPEALREWGKWWKLKQLAQSDPARGKVLDFARMKARAVWHRMGEYDRQVCIHLGLTDKDGED